MNPSLMALISESPLKRHAEVEAKDIRITVRHDSEVLLEGKVHSWDEKVTVENAHWSAPGVKQGQTHNSILARRQLGPVGLTAVSVPWRIYGSQNSA
jgi:BON domain-containing protein